MNLLTVSYKTQSMVFTIKDGNKTIHEEQLDIVSSARIKYTIQKLKQQFDCKLHGYAESRSMEETLQAYRGR